jgi:hypothetical protein
VPLYQWIEKKSGIRVEVLRHFDQYTDEPTAEEVAAVLQPGQELPADPQWEREIGGKQSLVRGENWGYGRKGYW